MYDKRFLIFLAIALLILGLTACVRPASTPPSTEAVPTSAESFPLPGETEDVMNQLEQAATQTIMAAQGTPMTSPTAPLVDATAVSPQETPVAGATSDVQLPAVPVQPAASATPVPLPSPTPGIPSSWTLQKGEHPYCIARRFNVNPDELLQPERAERRLILLRRHGAEDPPDRQYIPGEPLPAGTPDQLYGLLRGYDLLRGLRVW